MIHPQLLVKSNSLDTTLSFWIFLLNYICSLIKMTSCNLSFQLTDNCMFHWQAALLSLTEDLSSDLVTEEHLIKALSIVRPSLNPFLLNKYQQGSSQGKKLFVLWMVLNIHPCSSHPKKIIESSCLLGGGVIWGWWFLTGEETL